ncbi:MAG: phosphoglucosamine mutase [Candidatus Krumholzibacteria bacterium]|nr:phosphoglucosamine mutase [Candidatus Krumholzibacteria bacterium]MDH4337658.1 phosphoglucosamine mutase [Candidatus Krumholzibacteria bacterium]MDH5270262.1 phosphoglucosamine mutase [Candidatus Krumholzibacteria bacterium]
MAKKLLFSVAGARGIVGETIDVDVVTRLTLAYCSTLPDGPVVVGRDTRPSGESFAHAVMGAVTATGRDVIHLGIATTPTVELITERTDAVAGIIVTASHNPIQWNALKFLDHRGIFITKDISEKLLATFESGAFKLADGESTGQIREYRTAAQEHVEAIRGLVFVDAEMIRARRFTVVLDCINGAGSVIAPQLLDVLGVRVIQLNCVPDGNFYRDPEPRPDNLADLVECVRKSNADLGFATDPDADRLALVTGGTGAQPISEEYTLALAVDEVLSTRKGNVVVNLSTSGWIDHVARLHGVTVARTPVGEAHVVDRMLRDGAVVGGEGNGGVILPALHPGRDAMLGMALILQLLADRGATLAEIVAGYPPLLMSKAKVPLAGTFKPDRISDALRLNNPVTLDSQDGVKATFADGWLHLRVSNTEGIVRVIAEGPDAGRVEALQKIARKALAASW